MKTAIILFLSMQPLHGSAGAWVATQFARDLGKYIAIESDKTATQQVHPRFVVTEGSALQHALASYHVPVIMQGPPMWTYPKLPVQNARRLDKSFAVLPQSVSIPSTTPRSSDPESQKRTGRKRQNNNLRKKTRELLEKYAHLDVFGYLADKLTGGSGMAIPA
jgi:hypothetical protein